MKILAIDPSINHIGMAYLDWRGRNKFSFETERLNLQRNKDKRLPYRIISVFEEMRKGMNYWTPDIIVIEKPPKFARQKGRIGAVLNLNSVLLLAYAFSAIILAIHVAFPEVEIFDLKAGRVVTKQKAKMYLEQIGISTDNMSSHEIDALVLAIAVAQDKTLLMQ